MRILYVVHKYDYGQPERGYCFEHYNFYGSLVGMGHEVLYFDFPTIAAEMGRGEMNHRLMEVVRAEKPDLMFTVVWGDHLDPETVRRISEETQTVTLNWYCDDHWQFDHLSRHWTPRFNWVVTTAQRALEKYAQLGYENVIKSQWGCNPSCYRKLDLPLKYDVTFVGLPHGIRRGAIQSLRDAGIDVQVWGKGWGHGRISQQQMIEVFNQSRINLNFSEASSDGQRVGRIGRFAYQYVQRPLNRLPGGWRLSAMGRSVAAKLGKPAEPTHVPRQIKGRNFEVPGCGGLLLTGNADNLSDYYHVGKELLTFEGVGDLIEKIRHGLDHEDERAAIARAGYQRTMSEHTYAHRFNEIFRRIGLADTATSIQEKCMSRLAA